MLPGTANKYPVDGAILHEILHQIRFIIKGQARNILHVQVFHDGQNCFFMLLMVRIAGIDNMNQKVHMLAFFQG